uniref:Uncharacterized sensor-like histidine kinase ycf26 n=1 Tax=Neogoniolithon spectabile TaxID=231755 RepID=A0A3G3MH27_9FLOR|nr:two component sensor kinase [Neogoniolithon spectabile]AYR06134.1 two component sensor kinase [Neogoniolithon spectabile]
MNRVLVSWSNTGRKIRLTSIIVFLVSICITGFTYLALVRIEKQLVLTDIHFSQDLITVLSDTLNDICDCTSDYSIQSLLEQIYLQISSLRYLKLVDYKKSFFYSFPIEYCHVNIPLYLDQSFYYNNRLYQYSGKNIVCTIPLISNHIFSYLLILVFEVNPDILFISNLIFVVSLIIFVTIWSMFILGIFSNFSFFINLINDILIGLDNIAVGNFNYRIYNYSNSKLKSLVRAFNQMSERLELYELRNVEELAYERIKFETLLYTVSDAVILLDNELRLVAINKNAIRVLSWASTNLVGESILNYLPSHVKDALVPILNKIIQSTCLDNFILRPSEFYIELYQDSPKTVRILVAPVIDERYKVLVGLIMTLQDMTRESELNKAKNQFISNVSHELRTPLCNIGSFLETLIDYDHRLSSEQKSQFLATAYNETQRLNRLVDDVLDLSRLQAKYRYTLKPVNLLSMSVYIKRLYQIISINRNIEISIEISKELEIVYAHESSLCQVVSNLVSNALKFTHTHGKIVIRSYKVPLVYYGNLKKLNRHYSRFARIEVIDEGIGIEKLLYTHVFDRFMRVENNIHTLEGTGLGLPIVKNIVDKHGSAIYIHSEVKVGTSFWFDLPIKY